MLHSPRALIKTRTRRLLAGHQSSPEQDSEVNDFKYALRTRRRGATAHLTEIAADSVIGPNRKGGSMDWTSRRLATRQGRFRADLEGVPRSANDPQAR